ncbi:hypothetical protein J5N97_008172 [Dioscorea zingiberensis]|uniref:Uncharacterized protein n=1 Tax=Dioscorea zingiberensis TaxID=325984 RepID=A0A9D5DDE2_9LILI|nr:hypothetical protein J5N97_008172 [Dioscorea zingiberensis]
MSNSQPSTTTNTTNTTKPEDGNQGTILEKKVVETVDFRSPAGHEQPEKRPVQVVHEYPSTAANANKDSQ